MSDDYTIRPHGEIDRHGDGRQVVLAKVVEVDDTGDWSSGEVRVYGVRPVKAEFDLGAGLSSITPAERIDRTFYAAALAPDTVLAVDDLVLVAKSGRRWWIVPTLKLETAILGSDLDPVGAGGPATLEATGATVTVEPHGFAEGKLVEGQRVLVARAGEEWVVVAGKAAQWSEISFADVGLGEDFDLARPVGTLAATVSARAITPIRNEKTFLVLWDEYNSRLTAFEPGTGRGGEDCCGEGGGGPGMPGCGPGMAADDEACDGSVGGFPPGVECDRSECCEDDAQLTITACTTPCPDDAPETYVVKLGALGCCDEAGGTHTLTHDATCTWKSATFTCTDGEDEGTYQWVLVVSADPYGSTLTLTFVSGTDLGLPGIVYRAPAPWCCACENVMDLACPRGVKDDCTGPTWHVCVKPASGLDCDPEICIDAGDALIDSCGECAAAPTVYQVTFPAAGCCAGLEATHDLTHDGLGDGCQWTSAAITCGSSTYLLRLTLSGGGATLAPVLNTGDAVAGMDWSYTTDAFDCLCETALQLVGDDADCAGLPAAMCVEPVADPPPECGAILENFDAADGTELDDHGTWVADPEIVIRNAPPDGFGNHGKKLSFETNKATGVVVGTKDAGTAECEVKFIGWVPANAAVGEGIFLMYHLGVPFTDGLWLQLFTVEDTAQITVFWIDTEVNEELWTGGVEVTAEEIYRLTVQDGNWSLTRGGILLNNGVDDAAGALPGALPNTNHYVMGGIDVTDWAGAAPYMKELCVTDLSA